MTNNEFENSYVLSQAEVDRFNSEGYLIFNGFFDDNLTIRNSIQKRPSEGRQCL